MMVNAYLMLMVVLLWAGTLPVASLENQDQMRRMFWGKSVCNRYILPVNAVWIQRARCEDNKQFQCPTGFKSQVQTTCRNGLWHLEPTCQDCYKYTKDRFAAVDILNGFLNKTQAECDDLCSGNGQCSSFVVNFAKDCLLFSPPIFFASYNTTLAQCVDECSKLDDCLSFSHVGGSGRCFIFNATISIVNNTAPIRSFSGDTLVEKICPTIL
ncbi:hypothetical protein LOTGIDRAFT_235170 [Lottia gigantea]|uniref:Apple domain-containing protein n=1 Tax=Lottia gigantea TaxID=225164 RepID=V3Z819_LOTGI|nr:hypothetical protein LOTGIDRAFT_235170 [Lottia gigantea]ESO86988.1 hypothetical protein LOTGIDRAFT_235170 [Lottia gigantea]